MQKRDEISVVQLPIRVAHDLSRYDAPNCWASMDGRFEASKIEFSECLSELAEELCIGEFESVYGDDELNDESENYVG